MLWHDRIGRSPSRYKWLVFLWFSFCPFCCLIGAGMAFSKFQIDIGADFSDTSDTVSASGVLRF